MVRHARSEESSVWRAGCALQAVAVMVRNKLRSEQAVKGESLPVSESLTIILVYFEVAIIHY